MLLDKSNQSFLKSEQTEVSKSERSLEEMKKKESKKSLVNKNGIMTQFKDSIKSQSNKSSIISSPSIHKKISVKKPELGKNMKRKTNDTESNNSNMKKRPEDMKSIRSNSKKNIINASNKTS
jgi:hypothetical protein